ncbi:hypothetical protein Hdeb2414_s0007g00247121 [Helianthus debilis subsp. tardiflorus]
MLCYRNLYRICILSKLPSKHTGHCIYKSFEQRIFLIVCDESENLYNLGFL